MKSMIRGKIQVDRRSAAKIWGIAAAAALIVSVLVPAVPASADPATLELTKAPVITGAIYQRGVVKVSEPQWSEPGVTLRYEWLADGKTAPQESEEGDSANSPVYIVAAELGSTISVKITATKPGFEPATVVASRTEKVREPKHVNTVLPRIQGRIAVGRKVSVVPGKWRSEPVYGIMTAELRSDFFAWKVAGKVVHWGNETDFVIPATARGKKLTVEQITNRQLLPIGRATSKPVQVKVGSFAAKSVAIKGKAVAGRTLTVKARWSTEHVNVTYRWRVDGRTVSTAKSYTVAATDKGKKVTVRVTGKKAGYRTVKHTSAPVKITS